MKFEVTYRRIVEVEAESAEEAECCAASKIKHEHLKLGDPWLQLFDVKTECKEILL